MALGDILDSALLRPRNLVPAFLAVLIGVAAWFGIRPALSGSGGEQQPAAVESEVPDVTGEAPEPESEPEPVYPSVLVATREIQSGVLIVADLVTWVEWREEVDVNVAVVQDAVPLQAVLGGVTIRVFEEGEMLAWDGLILPGSPGFITAVLRPGRRAVTVEVDRATTDANIIYPGDHVDVIMVASGDTTPAGPSAQSIVRDVRVLAVGSTIMSLGRYGKASLTQAGAIEAVQPPAGETYTLEVVPKDAERIALAVNAGRLTLAIRPILGRSAPADTEPVRLREVMEDPKPPDRVRVIRGAAAAETVTLTGA